MSSVAVVLYDENDVGRVLSCVNSNGFLTHSENLLPMIDFALKCAGTSLDDIDVFGVVSGPGSFTGIRIGISTVKALAFQKENSCVAVSALDVLNEDCVEILCNLWQNDSITVPCIDARRKQVYNSIYIQEKNRFTKITSDRIISCYELGNELILLSEEHKRNIIFCGDSAELCMREIDIPNKYKIDVRSHNIAVSVCNLAFRKYKDGKCISPAEILPNYLIKTQAEREYIEK